jgi:DNA-binding response OmpR family regulator
MSGRTALVVHPDASVLAFASDALTLFQPGYRVATAPDLEKASEWLETLRPTLTVIGSVCGTTAEIGAWMRAHRLDAMSTVLVSGDADARAEAMAELGIAATVAEPIRLPELLDAVREVDSGIRSRKQADDDGARS